MCLELGAITDSLVRAGDFLGTCLLIAQGVFFDTRRFFFYLFFFSFFFNYFYSRFLFVFVQHLYGKLTIDFILLFHCVSVIFVEIPDIYIYLWLQGRNQ